MTQYDSAPETCEHIATVGSMIANVIYYLVQRAACHDHTKLLGIEKRTFDQITPQLRGVTYGSDEYRQTLRENREGIDHHTHNNLHHPEHYADGINGMTLIDLVEMFCDWKAASLRHADGNFEKSLVINKERFGISDQLAAIFENTRKGLGW